MGSKIKIEDTVVILDSSRSMFRCDFSQQDRLYLALNMIQRFIETKLMIDPKDRIALLEVGNSPKIICNFTSSEEELISSIKKINISGKGKLHEGISFAIQLLVKEMRKVGGKTQRILLISDNKTQEFNDKLNNLVIITKGLGVFVDSCQLGNSSGLNRTFLKRIAQDTGGEFGYFNNARAIVNSGKSFASKKPQKEENEFYSRKKEDNAPLLKEVALTLRRPSLLEIQMMLANKDISKQKCAICHSIKAPLTGADYYTEGRTCPSCDRAMHISCAAQWAKKSESKEDVFRCPFCFFLLKVPKSATTILDSGTLRGNRIKIVPQIITTTMIPIPQDRIYQIDASCTYCRNIFTDDNKAYQCKNCGVYYHEPCLIRMKEEISACRYCGAQL